jgi:hypothetical protein
MAVVNIRRVNLGTERDHVKTKKEVSHLQATKSDLRKSQLFQYLTPGRPNSRTVNKSISVV